jgi:hypothetical protein
VSPLYEAWKLNDPAGVGVVATESGTALPAPMVTVETVVPVPVQPPFPNIVYVTVPLIAVVTPAGGAIVAVS